MAFELRENSFFLFKRKDNRTNLGDKSVNPKAPPYKGKGLINGVEKEMALWYNKDKDMFKIQIRDKYIPQKPKEAPKQENNEEMELLF